MELYNTTKRLKKLSKVKVKEAITNLQRIRLDKYRTIMQMSCHSCLGLTTKGEFLKQLEDTEFKQCKNHCFALLKQAKYVEQQIAGYEDIPDVEETQSWWRKIFGR